MNAEQRREAGDIALQLIGIKARISGLGLFKTMHALDAATQQMGGELAEILSNSHER